MLLSYNECMQKYGTDYRMKKALADGSLFQKEKGVYSTSRNTAEIEVLQRKYPRTAITGQSAFFYHSLSDVIPDYYYLATRRTDTRIRDLRVKQTFIRDDIFAQGIIEMSYENSRLRIYSQERMLVELMRFRGKIPLDYYKEVIGNYRLRTEELDFYQVEEYAALFRNGSHLMDMIQMEVL